MQKVMETKVKKTGVAKAEEEEEKKRRKEKEKAKKEKTMKVNKVIEE